MKNKITSLIILFQTILYCNAQDSTIVLSASMLNTKFQSIPLGGINGWIFRTGNDTGWARVEIDEKGWKKLKPSQLSVSLADKNGRLEGWFRIDFILDSTFRGLNSCIRTNPWAASDIYIDGKYILSFGSTGAHGNSYHENNSSYRSFHSMALIPEQKHTLAIHIIDYVAPFNGRFLKTASLYATFNDFVELLGPASETRTTSFITNFIGYHCLYTGIIGAFGMLFWFLYLQNRDERNIFFIALSTTFFFIWVFLYTLSIVLTHLNFSQWWLLSFIAFQCWPIAVALMIYTVGKIFNFRYKKALFVFGVLFVGISIIQTYYPEADWNFAPHPVFATVLLFYIILSSWKKLKGAQWAVVAGIIFTTIFSFGWSYFRDYYKDIVFPYSNFFESGMCLSFPVSLMAYVSIRFKEILKDVEVNAKAVIQLSDEKKEHAITQQKLLQEEVERQTIELRTSLETLKSTQAQLVQSEKMASLGELTAGIAHEIQNPLNFVNNFSEVSSELMDEMNEGLDNGDIVEAKAIAADIKQNLEKISHHGKRADAIVKGMLQHSRKSTGQKEPTNINALADEYLRLAYQGLRAKDKSFNAELATHFDVNLPLINVIPQDIGRVFLNLFNNAFYAVYQKQKGLKTNYQPEVTVTTYGKNGYVVIEVKDNGIGMPNAIKDKIMQPFFTTKPTGEGTGLGLSLTYDIVVKGHSGNIEVDTREGEGSVFIVTLMV